MGKRGSTVPEEKVEDVKRLKQTTHTNMAVCYLKLGKHQKCIDACTKALEGGKISKAYFRRGQANLELRNLDEAKADFEKARELEPDNQAIVAELRRLQAAFKQHDAKEKKKFANMFDKMAKENKAEVPIPNATTTEAKDAGEASATDGSAVAASATES